MSSLQTVQGPMTKATTSLYNAPGRYDWAAKQVPRMTATRGPAGAETQERQPVENGEHSEEQQQQGLEPQDASNNHQNDNALSPWYFILFYSIFLMLYTNIYLQLDRLCMRTATTNVTHPIITKGIRDASASRALGTFFYFFFFLLLYY